MASRRLILLALAAFASGWLLMVATVEALSPRRYIVMFDWDSAELAPEAQEVAKDFVAFAEQMEPSRVTVVGHTDTSGASDYNLDLSLRRASAVAQALEGLGLEPSIVTVDARGESQTAVVTGDGVPEPLNRRVDIGWLK